MVSSMKPLLVFATDMEAAAVSSLCDDVQTAVCGVGAVEAAVGMMEILERYKPTSVVLCGIAGAYDHSLKVGDVVCVAVEQTTSLPAQYRKEYHATLSIPLPEVVSNTVLAVGAEPCGAKVENMEGAAIFALCLHYGVPCGEIRAISNYVSDSRELWDIPAALSNLARSIKMIY